MKKILAIALAIVMMLALVACGGSSAPAAAADDGAKVVVFWYDESDVFMGVVRDHMNKEFAALGITPDNPCPTGEVNRVVKGVILYPYTLN